MRDTITSKQLSLSIALAFAMILGTIGFSSLALAENHMHMEHVERGTILIATDKLNDTDFSKSVVYITEHSEHGSYGFIINKPTHMFVNEAMPDGHKTANPNHHIFFGGPFHVTALFVLTRDGDHDNLHTVSDGLFFGAGDAATIELNGPASTNVTRTYMGFSNWGPGQLASQIDQGVWIAVPGDKEEIFSEKPTELWQKLYRRWSGDWI